MNQRHSSRRIGTNVMENGDELERLYPPQSVLPTNKRIEPTLLSRIFARVFWLLKHIMLGLAALRKPQGGLCAARYAARVYGLLIPRS